MKETDSNEFCIRCGMPGLRRELLAKRYLLKDKDGRELETSTDMFHRVARAVAGVERQYDTADSGISALATRSLPMRDFHLS